MAIRDALQRRVACAVILIASIASSAGGCGGEERGHARVQEMFDRSCAFASCHSDSRRAGGLTLEAGSAHRALIDVTPFNTAAADAGLKLVVPGDLEASFLMHKVRSPLDPAYGVPMPAGSQGVSAADAMLLEAWILDGAPAL